MPPVTRVLGMLLMLLLAGCSDETVEAPNPRPPGWSQLPPFEPVAHPWGRYLEGRHIGLDPGHGGVQGDEGWAFEGPVNLAVALKLREFLVRDGAEVVMTRETDVRVPLAKRPKIVEDRGAEVFVSIHHNAIKGSLNNYTSTWVHGDPPGAEPACLDLARAIQRRIVDMMRTELKVPAPLLPDKLIAKEGGFRVLREAHVPAILCEASFYTNPEERKRLQDPEYVMREAYAYYLGLVDYFSGGTPALRRHSVRTTARGASLELELDDGLQGWGGWGSERPRIVPASLRCSIDGADVKLRYDPQRARVSIPMASVRSDSRLELHFENVFKHSNFPTRFQLRKTGSDGVELAEVKGSGR